MLGGRRASSDPGKAGLLEGTPQPRSLVWGLRQGLWVPTVPREGGCSHLLPTGRERHPCLSLPGPSPPRQVGERALQPLGPPGGQAPSPDADGVFVDGTENGWFKQTRQGPLLSAGEKAGSAHTLDTCLQGTYSWGRQCSGAKMSSIRLTPDSTQTFRSPELTGELQANVFRHRSEMTRGPWILAASRSGVQR